MGAKIQGFRGWKHQPNIVKIEGIERISSNFQRFKPVQTNAI